MTVPYTFGTESSPVPLSQLDANFAVIPNYANTAGTVINAVQANITSVGTLTALSVSGNIVAANINTPGIVSITGNVYSANVFTGGLISAYGNITGGNLNTVGITATGVVTGQNFNTAGIVSATGNITGGNVSTAGKISAQGNITTQSQISAAGNITTAANFVGNFLGNITGNLSVGGSNTQVLFNRNGNVGAAAGLTYNTDSNILGVLGTVSAQGSVTSGSNLSTGANLSVAGNATIAGTAQISGVVTGPTAPLGTANNQLATTAFVSSSVGVLGTMAAQNAVSVAITGGSIGNAIMNLATISNSAIATGNITNSTIDRITMPSGWSITPVGTTLIFSFGNVNLAKLDSSGNFTTVGDVIAFGTI